MLPLALLLALTGTFLLFDASPGINWGLWVSLVTAGIIGAQWMERGRAGRTTLGLCALACAFAWGPAITASAGAVALGAIAALLALSLAILSQPDEEGADVTIPRLMLAPMEAPVRGVAEAGRRVQDVVVRARREASLPVLRGVAVAVPVVGVFGLALSGADPVFADWRDRTFALMADFPMGELVFGTVLFIGCLGAFGLAARGGSVVPRIVGAIGQPMLRLGTTERLIVLGAIAALFACFLILQLTYLFGNAPAEQGSGVTFAEYARRGFFELTFVAAACGALLTIMRGGEGRPGDARVVQLLELTVVAEVVMLLVSAFRKMLLYEAAYGFTVSRLWVQAFMVVLALSLGALALELRGAFDVHRLARRSVAAGAAILLGLTYWNHEAWIARQNLDGFTGNGRYDQTYVAEQLSASAVPAALEAARTLGGVRGACMDRAIRTRWTERLTTDRSWLETSLAERRARAALERPPSSGRSAGQGAAGAEASCEEPASGNTDAAGPVS
jgi:hypothetical protein